MPDPDAPLHTLVETLSRLCGLLLRDPGGPWYRHFAACLQQAREQRAGPGDLAALHALADRVLSVYGGMGSFNDYVPRHEGRWIAGMEELEALSVQVWQAAHALRAVAGPLRDEPLV